MKHRHLALTLLLATLAGSACAQKLAPGLWEYSFIVTGGGAEAATARMQEEMARMPPEQRKKMEQMMAAQGVSTGPGKGMTMRMCITPEQAARDEIPHDKGGCKRTRMQRSGSTVRFAFECAGPPPSKGEGEFTIASSKSYSGRMQVDSTHKGQPLRTAMQQSGLWLAADCGSVKPRP